MRCSLLVMHRYDEVDTLRDSDHSPVFAAMILRLGNDANAIDDMKFVCFLALCYLHRFLIVWMTVSMKRVFLTV